MFHVIIFLLGFRSPALQDRIPGNRIIYPQESRTDSDERSIMARVTHYCPECKAEIHLVRSFAGDRDIKCPECGAWFAVAPRELESEDFSRGRGSNAGLWIGLAIRGGVLLLL